jgi:ABC-type nitrate/sulfonate/bicarbonate transport system, permease component
LNIRKALTPLLSALALLAIWQLLAMLLSSTSLPLPATVAGVFWQACLTGQLPYHLGITLLRLIASFAIAMPLGCAIGILLGRTKNSMPFSTTG